MFREKHQGLSLNNKGFTLIEMLVVLGIMGILAAVAVPYAQKMTKRTKEVELRSSLRTIRTAIDSFRDDVEAGRISKFCNCYSENHYPLTLEDLVEGAEKNGPVKKKQKYLRRIPRDPFADQSMSASEQWGIRSYSDGPDSRYWDGEDVYDIFTKYEGTALDGSKYSDW